MGSQVFDVDLLAFERGNDVERKSIVDGVMRSLETGFVYSAHDISYNFLDDVYGKLDEFFALAPDLKKTAIAEGANGQRGYLQFFLFFPASLNYFQSNVIDWKYKSMFVYLLF